MSIYGINNRVMYAYNDGNDANEFSRNAIYYISPNTAHMPANSYYSIMINIRMSVNDIVQFSIGLSITALYYRKKLNGVWDSWKSINYTTL